MGVPIINDGFDFLKNLTGRVGAKIQSKISPKALVCGKFGDAAAS